MSESAGEFAEDTTDTWNYSLIFSQNVKSQYFKLNSTTEELLFICFLKGIWFCPTVFVNSITSNTLDKNSMWKCL